MEHREQQTQEHRDQKELRVLKEHKEQQTQEHKEQTEHKVLKVR